MISTILRAAVCAVALMLAGCAKSPPEIVSVTGVVMLNGKPLPNALIQFTPMQPGLGMEYIATGETDEQGRYQLQCNGKPGACACENRVTVIDAPIPGDLRGNQAQEAKFVAGLKNRPIPPKYASVAGTPLVVNVAAGQAEYNLEVKR